MGRESKTSYPEFVGTGGLWLKEGRKGKFMSGYLEFTKDMIPLRLDLFVFKIEKPEPDGPQYRIMVKQWDFAPTRRIDFERKTS